ncbi:MAG: DctP family TRAP transporter solute-binding subunit [Desulfobacteraceae bacterium]
MKTGFRLLVMFSLVAFLASLPVSALAGGKIKFGHVAPPFHGQSKGVDAFAKYVKEKTNGKIDIATFPMGQLGSERSMAEQVRSGSLQIASITTAVLQNFAPQVAITDMPFIFPNRKTAYATLDDPEVQAKIFSYLPKKGFIGIGWTENEIRDFTNTKRDVRKPEDIAGLKVRVMNSPVYLDTFKQLGASTVGIPFPEVYNALQTGVIDAQENPLLTSILMKFTEVTKHVTRTQHCLTECIIIVNPDYWKSLSKSEQKIFREAAAVCIKTNREVNAALKQKLPKLGISVDEYCKKNGINVINLTPAEREVFRKAMIPVWDKYRKIMGNDIFDFMLAKIKAHQQ